MAFDDQKGQAMIDKRAARRAFDHAANTYDASAVLQREIGQRLLERLDYVRLEPRVVLDLGCGTGELLVTLKRRYRKARLIGLDFAPGMLHQAARRDTGLLRLNRPRWLCGDMEALPLADDSVDLIVSNASLQWANDLGAVFAEQLRVLRPGGLLLFTTFGPDTLSELRAAWRAADRSMQPTTTQLSRSADPDVIQTQPAGVKQHGDGRAGTGRHLTGPTALLDAGERHVSPFLDMHDIGDALIRARFADPVMDVERLTLTYSDVRALMWDLKHLGAHNALQQRPRGLTGRRRLMAMLDAYERFRVQGRLPSTWEVVHGHAWVGDKVQRQFETDEGVAIPLSAIPRPSGSGLRG